MAETYGDYFRGLGRSIGQGVTFGFGDEIEAGIRALGAGTYDEEVAKIRADLEKFRETNPVSAYGSEIAASLPTGLGLGALALRAGVRGVGKIGAVEGALYGAGVGEDAEDRAVSAAIGAPLGAVGAKVGEKVFEGIAPLVGRAMKARGAGAETRGSGEALMKEPVTTVKAYKLFKMDKDGGLHPLFVKMGDKQPLPVGKWIDAEAGELNPSTGKVKSSIGDLAYRPGFHAGDLPIATHIGGKVDPLTGARVKGSMKPNIREDNQVWAEVEMPADVDWQRIADSRARIMKSGKPDPKTAHITDELPMGGFYRYKTNPNMEGNWLISGQMKINRLLSDDEVRSINTAAGTADLPRMSELMSQGRGPSATVYDYETGTVYPLEKTVGEPRTSDLGPGGINPVTKDPLLGPFTADYSPIENALANAERLMNASPTKGLTGEQYLARLAEQPSVTKTEMNASGLASFLSRPENKRRKIPVAEVQQYLKENAPDIEVFKYTGDQNNVSYRQTQRFMDENAYSELGYGEITVNNRNAHPATSGHMLSHYRDQLGNFAHVRYSDHKDASGGVSRVVEENQFDLLQSLLSQERGREATSRVSTVKLTPEKVADYDARIEKLRASPEYPAFLQSGSDLTDAAAKLTKAQGVRDSLKTQQENLLKSKRNKGSLSLSQFRNAGELQRAEIAEGTVESARTQVDALIQMVSSDFLEDAAFQALKTTEVPRYSPSSDEIAEIITRAVNTPPRQLMEEILEAAKKRGKDPLAGFPPGAEPGGQQRARLARKFATPAERAMFTLSSRIESDAVFVYKGAGLSDSVSPSDAALRILDDDGLDASAFVRANMAKGMSGRQLKVTSDIVSKDRVTSVDLLDQLTKASDDVVAAGQVRTNAASDFESNSKRLVRKNKAITGDTDATPSADTKGFFEYAQKVNFLPVEAVPIDPVRRAQLVPNQPFDTPLQAARHNIMVTIRDAANDGVNRIYFPDYRDIAKIREINPEGFIKTVYKDAPEKVIKELKQQFPDLKTGRISPDEFVGNHLSEIGDEAEVTQPVLYIDISRASIDRLGIPRRYAKGGQVDLRSGIGNMFRLYS